MKRLLFCAFILSASCSKSDSKNKDTTAIGDTIVADDTAAADDGADTATADDGADTAAADDGADTAVADDGADTATADDGADKAAKPAPAAESNLQVLPKKWSQKQIKSYMKQLSSGLGVKCKHCHEAGNFASDSVKAKLAARKMLKMTRMLDKKYFGGKGKITCKTCHKGKVEI